MLEVLSAETYLGYERGENLPGGASRTEAMSNGQRPVPQRMGLSGSWTVKGEDAILDAGNGAIVYRFHARDLHLVLGPAPDGKPVCFRVTIDGWRRRRVAAWTSTRTDKGLSASSASTSSFVRPALRDRTFEFAS